MGRQTMLVVWGILIVLLALRFYLYFSSQLVYKEGETVTLTETLLAEPKIAANRQEFTVAGIRIIAPHFPLYHYGDQLTIKGKVSQGKTGNKQTIYFPIIEARKLNFPIIESIAKIRQHVLAVIHGYLPATAASLLAGILLGSRESFSPQLTQALRNTGMLHVVAASGMNVSMVALFFMTMLVHIFSRRIVAVIVICLLILYCAFALFQPSIIRAAIMAGLVFTASILNRQTVAIVGLLLAGYSMLFFSPMLLGDIGFQLSFAATAGLLVLKPVFEKSQTFFTILGKLPIVGQDLATTIVAQLATLPLLLSNFGTLSLVSVLVNALVLWTVPIVMMLGLIASLLSFLPILSYPLLLFALPFLAFFEKIILLFDRTEFVVTFQMPFMAAVGYYLFLIGVYLLLRKK